MVTLEKQDVDAVLSAFGLKACTSFQRIPAGTVNVNYNVETDHAHYFLRLNRGKAEEDVAYEAELLAELVARGVRTPRPSIAADGKSFVVYQNEFFSLFPFKPGKHVFPLDGVTEEISASVGRALRDVHRAGESLLQSFSRESRYHPREVRRRFDNFRGHPETRPYEEELLREFNWLERQDPVRQSATTSVIHGDLFPDNVLFDHGDLWLLDFEQASTGSIVYDLAVLVNAWCFSAGGTKLNTSNMRAILDGYGSPVEPRVLSVELRAVALRFTITRITDVLLANANHPGKDFREFFARLLFWRGVQEDELSSFLP